MLVLSLLPWQAAVSLPEGAATENTRDKSIHTGTLVLGGGAFQLSTHWFRTRLAPAHKSSSHMLLFHGLHTAHSPLWLQVWGVWAVQQVPVLGHASAAEGETLMQVGVRAGVVAVQQSCLESDQLSLSEKPG